jgi:hypothetical protein
MLFLACSFFIQNLHGCDADAYAPGAGNAREPNRSFPARFAEFATFVVCLRERNHEFCGTIHHFVSAACVHRKALLCAINSV